MNDVYAEPVNHEVSVSPEYEHLLIDSTTLIDRLSEDIALMAPVRRQACYQSVIDGLETLFDETPRFEQADKDMIPEYSGDEQTLTVVVGHKLDYELLPRSPEKELPWTAQVVLDAKIVGVIETTEDEPFSVKFTAADLAEFNYLVPVTTQDSAIITTTGAGFVNYHDFAEHIIEELQLRRLLLTDDSSIYKFIYTAIIESILDEHQITHNDPQEPTG